MFRKIGCLWTWTKVSGKSMNIVSIILVQVSFMVWKGPQYSLIRPQCLGNAAGFLVIVGNSETSSITCDLRLRWNSAKSIYAVKLNCMFMKHTRSYIWSWVWPLLVLDDRPTPVVERGVTCHSIAPHPWKQHIIHPRWVLLSLWEVFWENNLRDVMSPELSQIAPGE